MQGEPETADMPPDPEVLRGFGDAERARVATMFWEAFADKLGVVLAPEARALAFLEASVRPDRALVARAASGEILGVAGMKTEAGGLVAAGLPEIAVHYGWMGALWRGPLLELTERRIEPGQMLLDGLFVTASARGTGVGTALIEAVVDEAHELGLTQLCLEVVDSNPRARALYGRLGFRTVQEERGRLIGRAFGYRTLYVMARNV
ncbi:MAG: GNAT family N-acetyltransferase [Pseudomonadota bacterium]